MAAVSNDTVVSLFKRVYGNINELIPTSFPLARDIPFSQGQKVGDRFVEAFTLTFESGWTIAGSGQEAYDIAPSISGTVKQAEVIPSQTLLSSVIPFAFMSRSAGGGERAFADGTRHVMKNHLLSHGKLQEVLRLYGQAPALLGYVSYAPSGTVYRGATYTGNGNVTVGGVAFTAGVNTSSKAILFAPGSFAAGIWVGQEGVIVKQVDSSSVVQAQGKLVSVDADNGILYVDFTPVAASGLTSSRICFDGQESAKDMVGINKILTNTGTIFNISASTYALWRATQLDLGAKRFSLKAVQTGVAQAVNRGALEDPLVIYVNPRTFANLSNDEASLRRYDASYKGAEANNGFESIQFYCPNGVNEIRTHRMVKEGEAYGLLMDSWIRSGSAEISFNIPGIDKECIFPLENQAGWAVRSFSDQFIMCTQPSKNIIFTGINDEATSAY